MSPEEKWKRLYMFSFKVMNVRQEYYKEKINQKYGLWWDSGLGFKEEKA